MKYTITHIDTCLGSYLLDQHNREGELLMGVFVEGPQTTFSEVADALETEFFELISHAIDSSPTFDSVAAEAALENFTEELRSYGGEPFDSRLEEPDEDFEEHVQAWFLMRWGEELS